MFFFIMILAKNGFSVTQGVDIDETQWKVFQVNKKDCMELPQAFIVLDEKTWRYLDE